MILHSLFCYLFFYLFVFLLSFLISCGSLGSGNYKSQVGSYHFQGSKEFSSTRNSRDFRNSRRTRHFTPKGSFRLSWPVDSVQINDVYAPPSRPSHQGIDLGGKKGTPIKAAHEGVVIYAGGRYQGYGNMILIEFDEHWATLYAHLSVLFVKDGDVVRRGEVIGQMGATGRASGVHLHFELMKDKRPVDPLKHLDSSLVK